MKMARLLLVAGLLGAPLLAGADEPALPTEAAGQAEPLEGAVPDVAPPEEALRQAGPSEADLLEALKRDAEAAQQRPKDSNGVDYRPWAPSARTDLAPDKKSPRRARSPYHAVSMTGSAGRTYATQWGIDSLKVAYTSSGNLLRFTYRVLDPHLAAALADKKLTPALYSPKHHAVLSIPVMDKVGPLRQAMEQKAGMEYWMSFSNRGQLVKPGDRVNVSIGSFHADGLRVE